MKFKQYLQEEYIGRTKDICSGKMMAEVFKNPSKKEMASCGEHLRFIIDFKNKDLYVANSYECIHDEILETIRRDKPEFPRILYTESFWENHFGGYADYRNGKLIYTTHAEGCEGFVDAILKGKYNDSWLKQWFNTPNGFMNDVKEKRKSVNEEYFARAVNWNHKDMDIEIHKNPSKKEMASCGESIRFVVDFKNKNLYIAGAHHVIHNDILRSIVKNGGNDLGDDVSDQEFWSKAFAGFASYKGGKLKVTNHAEGCEEYIKDYSKFDDSWLKQWISGSLIKHIESMAW
jgi:hypothetical protein